MKPLRYFWPLPLFLAACTSSPGPDVPTATEINSFAANPNPSPANVATQFSWTVFGSDLTCQLDVDSNGTNDYTLDNCSSQSRVIHSYGVQGSFTAKLTLTGADGKTVQRSVPVVIAAPNSAPTVSTFQASAFLTDDPLEVRFTWTVNDSDADITHCRFDVESDGMWEFDGLCSGLPATSSVGRASAATFTLRHKFVSQGHYTATLEARDPHASTQASIPVRVPYNRAPLINTFNATVTNEGKANIGFSVSDPDGDSVSCTLEVETIGRFNYRNCAAMSRFYTLTEPGTHKVSLRITDELGATATRSTTLFVPKRVPPLLLASGTYHNCILGDDGNPWCWGKNEEGQLGLGNYLSPQILPTQANTSGVSGSKWTSLAAGAYTTCGIRNDGTAWCWGDNTFGQLGNNSNDPLFNLPVLVGTPSVSGSRWTAISPSADVTCGLRDDGSLWCWGSNASGLLGNNDSSHTNSKLPVQVTGTYQFIAAGYTHSCAIRDNGDAYCWGLGTNGTLGDNTGSSSDGPVLVNGAGTGKYVDIDMGQFHTCGLQTDGTAWCWGDDSSGQLGRGVGLDSSNIPVAVTGGHIFTQIEAGLSTTCALDVDGEIWCWGYGTEGNLGNGSSSNYSIEPVQVVSTGLTGTRFVNLWYGASFGCGQRDDNSLWCWGYNGNNVLARSDDLYSSEVPLVMPRP